MALVVADRIKETSTTSGTGTLTLAGASAGFRSFADIGNGNTTYYAIVDSNASTWEVGIGTYTLSGTTLSRDTVLSNSSGTTSLINFSANSKDVFVTYPASKSLYYQSSGGVVVSDASSNVALKITQSGPGTAFMVEDSASPDSTPFVITSSGIVVAGHTGNVGGADARVPNLQITGTSNNASTQGLNAFSSSATVFPSLQFNKSATTSLGGQLVVTNNAALGTMQFSGSDGTGFIRAAEITAVVDGTPGTNDMPGRLVFSTTADGASSPTERVRINSAGNVGIGLTPSNSYKLEVNGDVAGKEVVATNGIFFSSQTVSESVTFPSGFNGISGNNTTIASGVTVTIPSGADWTIV